MGANQRVAVVGATGLVGQEFIKIFQSDPELGDLELLKFASSTREDAQVMSLKDHGDELARCKYIINAASAEVAVEIREQLKPSQVLIDNSSAFRMDPEVPLVIPEVNAAVLQAEPHVIANPNCTTILLCMVLAGLKPWGLLRVIVSTYQAASGAGLQALEELDAQIKATALGQEIPKPQAFPFPLVSNVMSHNSKIREDTLVGLGFNDEEWKVIEETRKILDLRALQVSATCMRVPVRRAHTESVTIDLKKEITLEEWQEVLLRSPGIRLVNNVKQNHFPMPIEAENQDHVLVGRIRIDSMLPKTVHCILCGDQIRKGAATNALQILKLYRDFHDHHAATV